MKEKTEDVLADIAKRLASPMINSFNKCNEEKRFNDLPEVIECLATMAIMNNWMRITFLKDGADGEKIDVDINKLRIKYIEEKENATDNN